MRVSVLVADSMVVVDGVSRTVDLSDVDKNILAIQWDGIRGEVERVPGPWPVEILTDARAVLPYVNRWIAAEPPPPNPQPVLTKDQLLDARLADPVMKAIILVLAAKSGLTEAQLRDLVKVRLT